MSTRGPVPKRSSQRRRRNTPEVPVVTAPSSGRADKWPLAVDDWHPIARELYDSLRASGQSQFYEPSDWAKARLAAELTSRALEQSRPPAQLFAVIDSMWSGLLATEGDRRRLRIELERAGQGDADEEAAVMAIDEYRRRLSS